MGLGRGEWHIVDQTHENSAQQLWRVHFSLKELASRRPELKLKPHKAYGSIERKEVTDIVLPNGSIFTQGFQEAGADQGKGKTGVTLEEVSKYRQPSAFWAQSLIITMGEAGSKGGWVCGIANSSPNPDWRDIKGKLSARKLLGLE